MQTDSSTTSEITNSAAPAPSAFCRCGVGPADHVSPAGEALECDAARRRRDDRLAMERSHLELIETCLATVLLARTGRTPQAGGAFATLTETERREVTFYAQAAITSLDPELRKAARERGVTRGLESFRRWSGARELTTKTAYQLRDVILDAFNGYDCTLQGVTPFTPGELAAIAERRAH